MLFSSALFVFGFLPLVLGVYFVLHPRLRNPWLLLVSLVFYAWGEPVIVLVMLVSILTNYVFGLLVAGARGRGGGLGFVGAAVVFDIGLLIVFKYADWLWTLASSTLVAVGVVDRPWQPLGSHVGPDSPWRAILLESDDSIRLPIGISFFTFQALSYVIDVHRRDAPVQKNPLDLALYVALFPQLIAGPIVRYRDVAEQIVRRTITRTGFAYGVRRFVIGLGKKMLIANVCAEAADGVFGAGTVLPGIPAGELTPWLAWLALVAYTLQIYFDFSGYSDMAVGLGHMFGFRFKENFAHPYVARSITEFWRRWHISLSTWFRDYLYVPLGGNRRGPARTYTNLMIVFVLCGLWHGANLTFLVWGLYHGAFLIFERGRVGAWLERRAAPVRHAYAVLVVMIGWVFFRADTLGYAWGFLQALAGVRDGAQLVAVGERLVAAREIHTVASLVSVETWIAIGAGVLGALPWLPWLRARLDERAARGERRLARGFELAGFVGLCLVFAHAALALASGGYNPFIYFRF